MKSNWLLYQGKNKLGNVVGYRVKGEQILRAKASHVANPRTQKQVLVRARLSFISELGKMLMAAVNIGLQGACEGMQSPRNVFSKLNYDSITGSTPESLAINYEGLQVAKGGLYGVQFGTLDMSSAGEVAVPIENGNTFAPNDSRDNVIVAVFCPDRNACVVSNGEEVRTDESVLVSVPSQWTGLRVHVYGFVRGFVDPKEVSNSAYIGTGTIS